MIGLGSGVLGGYVSAYALCHFPQAIPECYDGGHRPAEWVLPLEVALSRGVYLFCMND